MHDTAHLLPHLERLLRRIESADGPLVQVWGWPGSGKATVLAAFLERQGPRAAGLALADLADEGQLRRALDALPTGGAQWLVANGDLGDPGDPGNPAAVARWLKPGQRLVFASARRRGPAPLPGAVLAPQEMLLTAQEIAALWYLLTGSPLDPETAKRVWRASDGWYRPLRLALEETGGIGLDASADTFLEIPSVRFFLRYEVLDTFSEEEKERLLEAPEERDGSGEPGWRILDDRGLWVEGEPRDRQPRLLAAALERERRRRFRPGRSASSSAAQAGGEEAAQTVPAYRLGLLGSPIALQTAPGGERDLDCRLRRSFQVLAFLASSPGFQAGREELMDAVWPIEGERTIERNFHPTLSHLRRALEGPVRGRDRVPLLFRGGVYRLNPEMVWEVDALDFSRLAEEGKDLARRGDAAAAAEAFQAAWKLYRGPFLQGHYEAWVTAKREGYQRLYLELLKELGDLYAQLERPGDAMDAYRTVLMEDPLQERIHLALMRIYSRQGRRDLVRRQYDRLSTLLLEELSVQPNEETTQEYHRLMA